MPNDRSLSSRAAAEAAGITYRQLDYWARTGLLRPSITEANGSGSRRRYSVRDVLALRVVAVVTTIGVPPGRLAEPIAELTGTRDFSGFMFVCPDGSVFWTIPDAPLFWCVDLDKIAAQVSPLLEVLTHA